MSISLIAYTLLSCKSISTEKVYEKNPSQDLLLLLQKLQIRIIYCCACCIFWLMSRLHFPVTCSFDDGTPESLIILSPVTRYFTTGWHALQFSIKDAYPSVLEMFTCKWMDVWNEKMVGREREFEAQGEKVITAVSRVDLRVIMAATLV